MKILDQNLHLSAQHYARTESAQQRLHENYVNGQLQSRETQTQLRVSERAGASSVTLGQMTLPDKNHGWALGHLRAPGKQDGSENPAQPNRQRETFTPPTPSAETSAAADNAPVLPPHLQRMIEAVEAMMERLTGKPYHLKVYGYDGAQEDKQAQPASAPTAQGSNQPASQPTNQLPNTPQNGNGMAVMGERWAVMSHYYEEQHTQFSAQGKVTTADGTQIAFDLNLQMSRTFASQFSAERTQGWVMKDPLTVNFGGTPAELTLQKYQFDIDADGTTDQISFAAPGSGFIALDKNGDGLINDGSELFGAQTGDGFAELAAYDEDGNGWIDENDAIFSKLQVWQKDANGLDSLQGLLALNIGAISLANVATPFDHKDSSNTLQGQVKNSGIFLYEDGRGAGTVQQIDLAV